LREVRKPQTMKPIGSATYRCVLGSTEQIEPDAKAQASDVAAASPARAVGLARCFPSAQAGSSRMLSSQLLF
jgi:hypothetical protein